MSSSRYGFTTLSATPATYDEDGRFYRRGHGGLVPISHAAFATAQHPGVVATAGVVTLLQVVALCFTVLAIDDRRSRAVGRRPS